MTGGAAARPQGQPSAESRRSPDLRGTARAAGLLLHPTSLPGRFGIGDLGPAAEEFLNWAASAGQSVWQVLPLGPTGHRGSPYGCLSAFAGNRLLISPERLVEEKFLPASALQDSPELPRDTIDWDGVWRWKAEVLRRAWTHSRTVGSRREEIEAFQRSPEQAHWLPDWALFAAMRSRLPWNSWGEELRRREPAAIASAKRELAGEIAYEVFLQFLFFRQWERVKRAANTRGISVMGDLPIYVTPDSVDVWTRPELFALDAAGRPELVAGVPPDYFSRTGQLWGYPLYRWDRIEEEGFAWWIARARMNFRLADIVRLDHFRAFAAYWAVPASETSALNGRWLPGPGRRLFDAIREALGDIAFVAEDLGTITPDVEELLAELGIPGMKVLQFAFSEDDGPHLPHRHVPNAVVYTGTHDNDTTRGWYAGLDPEARRRIEDYLGSDGRHIEWDLIRTAYASVGDLAVVPLQDVFGLGSEARMNNPALASGNWEWRARREDFTPQVAARLKRLAELTGRGSPPPGR